MFQNISPPFCLCYNLFYPKPILIIFGRNVAKGLCNVRMLTYLMLSLAVGYQLKCCYGSRQSNAWLTPGATVSHRWSNWPVAQTAQGLCESQRKALWTLTVTVWIVLSVLWLDFQLNVFFLWTWCEPLGVLVRIGSSCYKLLLMCIKQLWRKIICTFQCII